MCEHDAAFNDLIKMEEIEEMENKKKQKNKQKKTGITEVTGQNKQPEVTKTEETIALNNEIKSHYKTKGYNNKQPNMSLRKIRNTLEIVPKVNEEKEESKQKLSKQEESSLTAHKYEETMKKCNQEELSISNEKLHLIEQLKLAKNAYDDTSHRLDMKKQNIEKIPLIRNEIKALELKSLVDPTEALKAQALIAASKKRMSIVNSKYDDAILFIAKIKVGL